MKKTLIDWLNYMQSIHVSAIDMGLSRVLPVAKQLKLLESANKNHVFTVAGTNGKGSTTAVIAEICKQAGYTTALYQSPHLLEFNERVKINGTPVTDEVLINAFEKVEETRLACKLTLSFFEMTTLAAFLIFSEAKCDVWVLEVGLGGRLDVVNIIDADVAVITNIDIDHTDWLGDDIEEIGFEKAGILRPDIPFVYGSADMPASIKQHSKSLSAQCYQFEKDFYFTHTAGDTNSWQYSTAATTLSLTLPSVSLVNASNAITATLLSELSITQSDINKALTTVKLGGRFDYQKRQGRQWLFDVAHNKAGVEFMLTQLTDKIDELLQNSGQIHILFSMLKDKDIDTVVQLLNKSLSNLNKLPVAKKIESIQQWHIAPIDAVYCPRAASLMELTTVLDTHQVTYTQSATLAKATQSVIDATNENDLILVCGSFHTIKECLEYLTEKNL